MDFTFDIAVFLCLFVTAIILFSVEWFSADVVALGLMLALVLTGLLEPQAAFAGFGSETVMMILGLLILTESLVHTGMVDLLGSWLVKVIGNRPSRIKQFTLIAPSILSSFISNTAAAAFFMPIVLGLSRRSQVSASKLLMPLAFAAILAGSVTLIGTSTNLVVSGLMQQFGLAPLGIFELTPVGLPILLVGLVYMGTIGQRWIPDRIKTEQTEGSGKKADLYFTEITIPHGSNMVGKTIDASGLIYPMNLGMLSLHRGESILKPLAHEVLYAQDVLLVEGTRESVLALANNADIEMSGRIEQIENLQDEMLRTAEVVILPSSPLVGGTVKGLGLRERYQLQILAVNQGGEIRHSKIGRLKLSTGDVLLIRLPVQNLNALASDRSFRVLDIIETRVIDLRKVFTALAIFVVALGVAMTGLVSIAVASMLGAVAVFVTGCITPEVAYRNIEWKTLILIGSMLAFGQAMQATGTANFLADLIIRLPFSQSPYGLLTLFFFLAMLLTQPMSNQSAAAVLVPIAMQTAVLLGFDPRPFAIMIALAASTSYITPLEPACVLVYGAGHYKFMDFIRVGGILSLLVYVVAILLVPMLWHV